MKKETKKMWRDILTGFFFLFLFPLWLPVALLGLLGKWLNEK